MNFWQNNLKELEKAFSTSADTGLTDQQAAEKLKTEGFNEMKRIRIRNPIRIFLEQFKNLLVFLLIVAGGLSLLLGSYRDATVLFAIVIINAIIGYYQDWKSENILASITKLIVEKCIVIRSGARKQIPVNLLVKGDLVVLNEGDGIPADLRLVNSTSLAANEFILTGESQPAEKNSNSIPGEDAGIAERDNCVFMGTTLARGEAIGMVCATGINTELGKIARSSSEIITDISPLQKEINKLAYKITAITLVLAVVLFTSRLILNDTIGDAIVFAIGIAAAMVPSGLPAQISIALSLGVQRLAKRNAIVKRLPSVEALGAATVIASDKTGTITKNEMTINFCHFEGHDYKITGTGFEPAGEILDMDSAPLKSHNLGDRKISFIAGYLASTSRVNPPDEFHKTWYSMGDPTESAFATLALKAGYTLESLDKEYHKIQLFPFDSVRKRISVIREHKGYHVSFVKGSIESLLEICSNFCDKDILRKLDDEHKENLLALSKAYAAHGLRIIAIAFKDFSEPKKSYTMEEAESNLTFSGFVSMMDPPHEAVKDALTAAYGAQIRVLMITGDNEITAAAIAEQIGLRNEGNQLPRIVNQNKLKGLSDAELGNILKDRSLIFSRVSPEEKLRIVSLLQKQGEVVAVTGDGVNDTLSLKKADIGVAMGRNGSKIAQEAATMILLDDNFSTIVYAIREGRTIYKNIQKNVVAILSSNLAELICVLAGFAGVFFGFPVVILAIHILLIDLLGEMLPLLALSFDPAQSSLMNEPPRKHGQMVDTPVLLSVLFSGLLRGTIALWAFYEVYTSNAGSPVMHQLGVTATFATIILTQFVNIFSTRSTTTIFNKYSFSNIYLFGGMFISSIVMGLIIYLPFLNLFLHTGPLSLGDLKFVLVGSLIYLTIMEILKAAGKLLNP